MTAPNSRGVRFRPGLRTKRAISHVKSYLLTRSMKHWSCCDRIPARDSGYSRLDAESHPDPETPKGAKGQLEQRMETRRSYSETADQAALTHGSDLGSAYRACRSFRRMVKAFSNLVVALGVQLPNLWPPPDWLPRQAGNRPPSAADLAEPIRLSSNAAARRRRSRGCRTLSIRWPKPWASDSSRRLCGTLGELERAAHA